MAIYSQLPIAKKQQQKTKNKKKQKKKQKKTYKWLFTVNYH